MSFLANVVTAVRYLKDPRVSWGRKIWFYLALFYLLFPLDFLPDLLPGLGWLDDLAVLSAGLLWFAGELNRYRGRQAPKDVGDVRTIDVEYAVEADKKREDEHN